MTGKFLSRGDAPLEAGTWELLDRAVTETARATLSGRRLLDIEGPFGLGMKTVPLSDAESKGATVTSAVLPLTLITQSFTLAKRDLAAFEGSGVMLDTAPALAAAFECARLEDEIVFKGNSTTAGLLNVRNGNKFKLGAWDEVGAAADDIIKTVTVLDGAGFHGPYALALAPARYNLLLRRYPNGNFSELEHVRTMVAAGVFKAPALESGGVLMASGRIFASIVLGQDMSVGFIGPVGERLEFSVSESLALFIRQPKAVCRLEG